MSKLKEISPGVYQVPDKDLKRIKKNQVKRLQRQAKRRPSKSKAHSYGFGYQGNRRHNPVTGKEQPNETRLFDKIKVLGFAVVENPPNPHAKILSVRVLSKEAKDKAYANMLENLGVVNLGF